jgi:hypothetical protein
MIGDHHGRTGRRATLLVRAMDEILGTHRCCIDGSGVTTSGGPMMLAGDSCHEAM